MDVTNLAFELNELGYDVTPSQLLQFKGVKFESPRDMLVYVGTDICRKVVSSTIWVDLMVSTINNTNGNVVVTDARFKNERDALRNIGAITIWIDRPELSKKFIFSEAHISETDQISDSYDVTIINDRSKEFLQETICLWYTLKYVTR